MNVFYDRMCYFCSINAKRNANKRWKEVHLKLEIHLHKSFSVVKCLSSHLLLLGSLFFFFLRTNGLAPVCFGNDWVVMQRVKKISLIWWFYIGSILSLTLQKVLLKATSFLPSFTFPFITPGIRVLCFRRLMSLEPCAPGEKKNLNRFFFF